MLETLPNLNMSNHRVYRGLIIKNGPNTTPPSLLHYDATFSVHPDRDRGIDPIEFLLPLLFNEIQFFLKCIGATHAVEVIEYSKG